MQSLAASSSVSRISSFIAPVNARFSPVSRSSNFGHSIPGVSSRSIPIEVGTHCLSRVTPGLSSTFAFLAPVRRFMSELFPTFGIPTIMARTLLPTAPFSSYLFIFSERISLTFGAICDIPYPFWESIAMTFAPRRDSARIHSFVASGEASDDFVRSVSLGFARQSVSISGFRELLGILASQSSITISTSFRFSPMRRRVFAICPGNHCIFCDGIVFLSCTAISRIPLFCRRGEHA